MIMFILLAPVLYSVFYMYRGANFQVDTWMGKISFLRKAVEKASSVAEKEGRHFGYVAGFRLPISYAYMALMITVAVGGDLLAFAAAFAAQWLAYQPAPDMVAELVSRQKHHANGKVNKFHHETMMMRHAFSGVVLAAAASYWSLWALLLIPAHIIGAYGYKQGNYPEGERRLGIAVGISIVLIAFAKYYL